MTANISSINRAFFTVLLTMYSCQSCGGVCQITDEMVTASQAVLSRITGLKENEYSKLCPYCKTQATFKRIFRP